MTHVPEALLARNLKPFVGFKKDGMRMLYDHRRGFRTYLGGDNAKFRQALPVTVHTPWLEHSAAANPADMNCPPKLGWARLVAAQVRPYHLLACHAIPAARASTYTYQPWALCPTAPFLLLTAATRR